MNEKIDCNIKSKTIKFYDVEDFSKFVQEAPVERDFDAYKFPNIVSELKLSALVPTEDKEDFIFKYTDDAFFSFMHLNSKDYSGLVGRSYKKSLPYFANFFIPIFQSTLTSMKKDIVKIFVYEKNKIVAAFEMNIVPDDDLVVFYLEDKSEEFYLKSDIELEFLNSPLPQCIIQDGCIIRTNKSHDKLSGQTEEELKGAPISIFDVNEITYNDTGLVLNFTQIVENILNDSYDSISYNMIVSTLINGTRHMHVVARKIEYADKPAVRITVVKDVDDTEADSIRASTRNIDLLQEYTKSALIFYDLKANLYTWGRGLETILEGPIPVGASLTDVMYPLIVEEDSERMKQVEHEIGLNKQHIETNYRIRTFKGNVKYIHLILDAVIEDGEVVRWIHVLEDISDIKSKEEEISHLKEDEDSKFVNYPLPQTILQDGILIRANKAHDLLTDQTEDELKGTPISAFDVNEITYNDTGLVLNFSQIVDYVLNDSYESISYNMVVSTMIHDAKHLQSIARKIEYNGKPAIENTVLKEVSGSEVDSLRFAAQNIDLLQEYTKSAFIFYDLRTNSYTWGRGLEDILEGPIPIGSALAEIMYPLIVPEDFDRMKQVEVDIGMNKDHIETTYRIRTFKGNVKYVHLILDAVYEDDEVVRWFHVLEDVTDVKVKEEELTKLGVTMEDVQVSTNTSIQYLEANGKYTWSPQTYRILEREPRESDRDYNIIMDRASDEDKNHFMNLFKELEPNAFLGKRTLTITTESGKTKYIDIDVHNINDENGNFIQRSGYTQDVTARVLAEKQNALLNQIIEVVLNHLKIGTFSISLPETATFDEGFCEITDIESGSIEKVVQQLESNLVESEDLVKELSQFFHSGEDSYERIFEYNHPTDGRKYIATYIVPYNAGGEDFFIGAIQDVTTRVEYENAIIESDYEKTILVKEIHHRVKNNLQLITSFINLEHRFHKEDPETIIDITKKRIDSLALIHESIYNEEDMNYIDFEHFLKDFDSHLYSLSTKKDITFINDVEEHMSLSVDILTPLILMINELTTNSFKYAWDDDFEGDKEIFKSINYYENEDGETFCKFIYRDTGKGLPDDLDMHNLTSLGWLIISSLAGQIDADYDVFNKNGFNFILDIPIKYKLGGGERLKSS